MSTYNTFLFHSLKDIWLRSGYLLKFHIGESCKDCVAILSNLKMVLSQGRDSLCLQNRLVITRSKKGRVEDVDSVGGHNDFDVLGGFKAVQLIEKL